MIKPFTLSTESRHTIDVDAITVIRQPKSIGKASTWQIKIFFSWRHDSLIFEYEEKEAAFSDYVAIIDLIYKEKK